MPGRALSCPVLPAAARTPAAPPVPGPGTASSSRSDPGGWGGGTRRPHRSRCRRSPRAAPTGRPRRDPPGSHLGPAQPAAEGGGQHGAPRSSAAARLPAPAARRRGGPAPGTARGRTRAVSAQPRHRDDLADRPPPRPARGGTRGFPAAGWREVTTARRTGSPWRGGRGRVPRGAGRVPPPAAPSPSPGAALRSRFSAPVPGCNPQAPGCPLPVPRPSLPSSLALPSRFPSPCSPRGPTFRAQGHPRGPAPQPQPRASPGWGGTLEGRHLRTPACSLLHGLCKVWGAERAAAVGGRQRSPSVGAEGVKWPRKGPRVLGALGTANRPVCAGGGGCSCVAPSLALPATGCGCR